MITHIKGRNIDLHSHPVRNIDVVRDYYLAMPTRTILLTRNNKDRLIELLTLLSCL